MSESDELYNFLIHRRTIHSKKLIKKEHIKKEPNASNLSHKIKYREEKNIDPFNSILYLEFNKYLKKMGIPDNFFDLDVLGNCLRKIYYEKMGIKGKRISPFFMLEQYYGKNIFSHLNKLGIELEPVYCGGSKDEWVQEREQWHSGANFFAIAPGKVMGYQRNVHTIDEMNNKGYEIITAEDVIAGKENPNNYKKVGNIIRCFLAA